MMEAHREPDLILSGDVGAYWRRRLLVHEARRWVAFTEQGGDNRGQLVEAFQKAVDGKATGEPWCAAFVWWCIRHVDALAAEVFTDRRPSVLVPSEHVLTMWRRSTEAARAQLPAPGDLMLWNHHRDGQPTEAGHMGIVVDYPGDGLVRTIEGNTGPGAGVVREGDGIYQKLRKMEGEGAMRTLGFLRVWM